LGASRGYSSKFGIRATSASHEQTAMNVARMRATRLHVTTTTRILIKARLIVQNMFQLMSSPDQQTHHDFSWFGYSGVAATGASRYARTCGKSVNAESESWQSGTNVRLPIRMSRLSQCHLELTGTAYLMYYSRPSGILYWRSMREVSHPPDSCSNAPQIQAVNLPNIS
jgi:hypothetical protein